MITTRRNLLKATAALAATTQLPAFASGSGGAAANVPVMNLTKSALKKTIPSSGEPLSVIGMGTARTFKNADDVDFQQQLLEVLKVFFDNGGELLDSSPMYGDAETIIGQLLPKLSNTTNLFAATKVWTEGEQEGIAQMQSSLQKMSVPVMDLMQIHNLVDWKVQLKTLQQWKEQGKIRYLGITTSHGRSHSDLLKILEKEPLDFVQFSYNIVEREAEDRLLPMAADKGIATLINRPYQQGGLFKRSKDQPLPALAEDLGCESWGQLYLKWILGHPAATCVIPATTKPKHTLDNMGAGFGRLPDMAERGELLKLFNAL